jgi:hypothetical protein
LPPSLASSAAGRADPWRRPPTPSSVQIQAACRRLLPRH